MSKTAAISNAATMATSSMTLASSYSQSDARSQQQKVEQEIQQLRTSITRYARANDRRMILRSMKEVKYLSCVYLDPVPAYDGSLEDLETELQTEMVTLNGTTFRPAVELRTSRNNTALTTLRSLCDKLCDNANGNLQPAELYRSIILRIAQTTASADPYFQLNSFLGSAELLLQPIDSRSGQKVANPESNRTDSSVDSSGDHNEIIVNLYVSQGNIHITISTVYWFGLFRKSDVKPGKPWISIEGLVHERTNLSNDKSVRTLNVKLPALY